MSPINLISNILGFRATGVWGFGSVGVSGLGLGGSRLGGFLRLIEIISPSLRSMGFES